MIANYMEEDRIDRLFGALSAAPRRAILSRLARGPCSVKELAAPLRMSLPSVSRHIKVLEQSGLLRRTVEGRIHRCRLDPAPLDAAAGWLEATRSLWEERFDRLADCLNGMDDAD